MSEADNQKKASALAALEYVEAGMRLGLGTGSTAEHFVRGLGERVAVGLEVVAVPTSERTRELAEQLSIPLTTLSETPRLDLTVDGADETDRQLRLIKGGGGALLREKIVASSSERMIVIADASKLVETLGEFPLPVEVVPFGASATAGKVAAGAAELGCTGPIELRCDEFGEPFVTDGNNFIYDCAFGAIPDPEALAAFLNDVPGVVDHGLFIGIATLALIGGPGGVDVLQGA